MDAHMHISFQNLLPPFTQLEDPILPGHLRFLSEKLLKVGFSCCPKINLKISTNFLDILMLCPRQLKG